MTAVNAINKELDAIKDGVSDLKGDLKVEQELHRLTKLELMAARSRRRIGFYVVGLVVAIVAAVTAAHFLPLVLPWIGLA